MAKKQKRVKPLKFEKFVQQMVCTRCRRPDAELKVEFRIKWVSIEYHCPLCWPDSLSHARERARLVDVVKLLIDLAHSPLLSTQAVVSTNDPQATRAWAERLRAEALKPASPFLMFDDVVRKKPPTKKAVRKWLKPKVRSKPKPAPRRKR